MKKEVRDWIDKIQDSNKRKRIELIYFYITKEFPTLDVQIKWNQLFFIEDATFIFAISTSKGYINLAPERETIVFYKHKIKYETTSNLIKIKDSEEIDYKLLKNLINKNISDKKGYKKFWRK